MLAMFAQQMQAVVVAWQVYDITREADGSTLTMAAEGPAMDGNGKANYKDVIKWVDNDTREFSGWTQKPDGTWSQMMSSTLKRKK